MNDRPCYTEGENLVFSSKEMHVQPEVLVLIHVPYKGRETNTFRHRQTSITGHSRF